MKRKRTLIDFLNSKGFYATLFTCMFAVLAVAAVVSLRNISSLAKLAAKSNETVNPTYMEQNSSVPSANLQEGDNQHIADGGVPLEKIMENQLGEVVAPSGNKPLVDVSPDMQVDPSQLGVAEKITDTTAATTTNTSTSVTSSAADKTTSNGITVFETAENSKNNSSTAKDSTSQPLVKTVPESQKKSTKKSKEETPAIISNSKPVSVIASTAEKSQVSQPDLADENVYEDDGQPVMASADKTIDTPVANDIAQGSVSIENMVKPVDGKIVMNYSPDHAVYDITLEQYRTNPAISVKVPEGTAVKAAASGTVKTVSANPREGNFVVISHGNGLESMYGQLQPVVDIKQGDTVSKNQQIGTVAAPTKYSVNEGAHLYFAVTQNQLPQNPEVMFNK